MAITWFPSPYGDCGSYLRDSEEQATVQSRHVSVPLRGLWFLSVLKTAFNANFEIKFPSPYGDYGSYRDGVKFH